MQYGSGNLTDQMMYELFPKARRNSLASGKVSGKLQGLQIGIITEGIFEGMLLMMSLTSYGSLITLGLIRISFRDCNPFSSTQSVPYLYIAIELSLKASSSCIRVYGSYCETLFFIINFSICLTNLELLKVFASSLNLYCSRKICASLALSWSRKCQSRSLVRRLWCLT